MRIARKSNLLKTSKVNKRINRLKSKRFLAVHVTLLF